MNIVLSIILGFMLVVFQTACLPEIGIFDCYFDLLLPLVVYISIFRPVLERTLLILFFGMVMDSISGSPFGLYIITYIWLLLGVRGSMHFLDAGSFFLFPLILAVGVVFENLLFSVSTFRAPPMAVFTQALWALPLAPGFMGMCPKDFWRP